MTLFLTRSRGRVSLILLFDHILVGKNKISGDIPTELGALEKLKVLHVGENSITGDVPTELGNLNELQRLEIGRFW